MKNRIQVKSFILGFLVAILIFASVTTVFAASASKKIDVYYDNYKIYIDGEKFVSTDKNGAIEPFSYNGWIYAPFEKIAQALGQQVQWDGKTNSLYIGVKPGQKEILGFDLEPYQNMSKGYFEIVPSVKMGGTQYTNALKFGPNGVGTNVSKDSASFNLDGKYSVISGKMGHVDGSDDKNMTIDILGDGKIIKTLELTPTMFGEDLSFSVEGIKQLKFVQHFTVQGGCAYALCDMELIK